MSTQPNQPAVSSLQKSRDLVLGFLFNGGANSTSDVQNAVLVVMALIAAATFQAGLNPPGGVWQDTTNAHEVGTAIWGSYGQKCRVFFFFNTLAFVTSITVIMLIVYRLPFFAEVYIGMMSFSAAYGTSSISLNIRSDACLNKPLFAFAYLLPFVILLIRLYHTYKSVASTARTARQGQSA